MLTACAARCLSFSRAWCSRAAIFSRSWRAACNSWCSRASCDTGVKWVRSPVAHLVICTEFCDGRFIVDSLVLAHIYKGLLTVETDRVTERWSRGGEGCGERWCTYLVDLGIRVCLHRLRREFPLQLFDLGVGHLLVELWRRVRRPSARVPVPNKQDEVVGVRLGYLLPRLLSPLDHIQSERFCGLRRAQAEIVHLGTPRRMRGPLLMGLFKCKGQGGEPGDEKCSD